jgi:hypothetical protein
MIEENNKNPLCFKAECERLGKIGVVITTELLLEEDPDNYKCCPPYNPFALMLAANVKYMFRDLSITIKPTQFKEKTTKTEIIMQ